jgi:catechol 2,3-dioxygenase-like lactoylglutathione lyase family enzyme
MTTTLAAAAKLLVEPMKRSAILVRDLQTSLKFYQDVLGLTVWVEGESGPDNVILSKLIGLPPCRMRYTILQAGPIAQGMVGLFEVPDAGVMADAPPGTGPARRGEVALVFHTSDCEAIHRGALALGFEIVCPPQHLEIPEAGVSSLEMTLRDGNGVLVNLIQSLNAGPQPAGYSRSRFRA